MTHPATSTISPRGVIERRGVLYSPAALPRITPSESEAAHAARPNAQRVAGPRTLVNAASREPLPATDWRAVREGADDYLAIPSLGPEPR